MARPRKATVDYFSHDCNYGKTIPIIEKTYGLEGYAIWFKILEQLGKTENHFIDCRDDVVWLYLVAEIGADEDTVRGVVDLASRLGAIDQPLWKNSVIASQKFLDRVEDVYSKRTVEMPLMSRIYQVNGVSAPETRVSGVDNPQSKVNETIVNENDVELFVFGGEKVACSQHLIVDEFRVLFDEFTEHRKEIKKPMTYRAAKSMLKKLSTLSLAGATNAINDSIANGWQDVFPEKYEKVNNVSGVRPETPIDDLLGLGQ